MDFTDYKKGELADKSTNPNHSERHVLAITPKRIDMEEIDVNALFKMIEKIVNLRKFTITSFFIRNSSIDNTQSLDYARLKANTPISTVINTMVEMNADTIYLEGLYKRNCLSKKVEASIILDLYYDKLFWRIDGLTNISTIKAYETYISKIEKIKLRKVGLNNG